MTSTARVRAHRARIRAERARAWREDIGADMAPVLSSWSAIGLRWAPSPAQVDLIRGAAPTMALRMEAGGLLRRLPRARASRGHSAVYMLVRSLLASIAALVAALSAAHPLPGERRQSTGQLEPDPQGALPSPGAPAGSGPPTPLGQPRPLLERLRRHGLSDELAQEWAEPRPTDDRG